ncbi:MAG: hypothetical protein JSV36_20990 [Anaerolineae bacterium]|nr:MAG: hypothetical protein JSV36_20990 [Anaerolineae bacterium]
MADGDVQAVIENQGNRDAGPFWVDLYVDPDPPPTQAYQLWYDLCRDPFVGISWWVDGLAVGESTTLTSLGGYAAQHSRWPGSLPPGRHDLYVYADTWRPLVSSGAVAESDETNNRAELLGVEVSAAGRAGEGPWPPVVLPPRPVTPGE